MKVQLFIAHNFKLCCFRGAWDRLRIKLEEGLGKGEFSIIYERLSAKWEKMFIY